MHKTNWSKQNHVIRNKGTSFFYVFFFSWEQLFFSKNLNTVQYLTKLSTIRMFTTKKLNTTWKEKGNIMLNCKKIQTHSQFRRSYRFSLIKKMFCSSCLVFSCVYSFLIKWWNSILFSQIDVICKNALEISSVYRRNVRLWHLSNFSFTLKSCILKKDRICISALRLY